MAALWKRAEITALAAVVLLITLATLHLVRRLNVSATEMPFVELVDQNGKTASLSDWFGKIVVLDFIYTACGDICPVKTAQLAAAQASLTPERRRTIQFVSVSVDPEHDDPAALKAYALRTGADLSNWSFLTGDLDNVARIATAFDAGSEIGGKSASHITAVHLINQHGQVVYESFDGALDGFRIARELAVLSSSGAARN